MTLAERIGLLPVGWQKEKGRGLMQNPLADVGRMLARLFGRSWMHRGDGR